MGLGKDSQTKCKQNTDSEKAVKSKMKSCKIQTCGWNPKGGYS